MMQMLLAILGAWSYLTDTQYSHMSSSWFPAKTCWEMVKGPKDGISSDWGSMLTSMLRLTLFEQHLVELNIYSSWAALGFSLLELWTGPKPRLRSNKILLWQDINHLHHLCNCGAQSLSLQYQCPFLPPGESRKANFLGDVHQIPKHFTDLGPWWLYDALKTTPHNWSVQKQRRWMVVLQIWSRGYNTMINCCEKEWGPATQIFRHINDMSLRAVERNCASFNTLISCHGQVGMGVWARWQLPFGMHGTVIEAKDPWPKHITFSILNSGL